MSMYTCTQCNTEQSWSPFTDSICDTCWEEQRATTILFLQKAQDTIARRNNTVGIDKISPEEMDLQHAINVIQNL